MYTILGFKVCTRKFNNEFFHNLITQRSGLAVFSPFACFVSSRTWSHMTPNILIFCPTEIDPEICKNCCCAFLCSFSSTNSHPFIFWAVKFFMPKLTKTFTRKGVCGTKIILQRKVVPFTNSQPTKPPMYICKKIDGTLVLALFLWAVLFFWIFVSRNMKM